MVSHQLVTTVIALFVIAIIALVAVTAFTILRYKQTKAQGHLHILVPLLSQLIGCILIFTPVGPQAYACTTVIASYSTAAIIAFHSAQWAKSMRNHIGTKTVKFFQGAFYFWMAVYIIVAIIVCIFFSSAYDTSILGGFTTNNSGSAFAAVFVIAYFLAIIGAVFGFFSSISYIMLLPKSAEQYGNQKKRQAIRLMAMFIVLIVAVIFPAGVIISILPLIIIYILTLAPRNAMQNYSAAPEECAQTIPMSLPVPGQHMMPVVIQVPHGHVPANAVPVNTAPVYAAPVHATPVHAAPAHGHPY